MYGGLRPDFLNTWYYPRAFISPGGHMLKNLIIGTPLEAPARSLLRLLRGSESPRSKTEWDLRTQRDEANINHLLRDTSKAGSNCVHIGAHQGVFLKRIIALSPEGRHFAFEPLPAMASALKVNFPTVDVFHCALGNRIGRVAFCHVLHLPAWSGLKTQPYPVKGKVETIEVDIKRLDDVLPPAVHIDFIKIDVEGAELEVLEGAKATIKQYRPSILFEHAKIHNLEYIRTT